MPRAGIVSRVDVAATLASVALLASEPSKPGLVRWALWLWIGLAGGGVLLVLIVWVLASGVAKRSVGAGERAPKRRVIKDPWVEAGRRAEPLEPESEDDVAEEDDLEDGDGP